VEDNRKVVALRTRKRISVRSLQSSFLQEGVHYAAKIPPPLRGRRLFFEADAGAYEVPSREHRVVVSAREHVARRRRQDLGAADGDGHFPPTPGDALEELVDPAA